MLSLDKAAYDNMSRVQKFSFWTSLSFVPGMVILLHAGSVAGYVQLLAMLVTLAYHYTSEKRFVLADYGMAGVVMGCNGGMVLWSRHMTWTSIGLGLLVPAIWTWYRAGKAKDSQKYYLLHGIWHLICGTINVFFALGYV